MRSGVITFLGLNFSANMCYFLTFSRKKKKGQFLVNPIFFGRGRHFWCENNKKNHAKLENSDEFFHSPFNPLPFWYIFRTRILKFKRQACQFFITYGMNPGCGVENGFKIIFETLNFLSCMHTR